MDDNIWICFGLYLSINLDVRMYDSVMDDKFAWCLFLFVYFTLYYYCRRLRFRKYLFREKKNMSPTLFPNQFSCNCVFVCVCVCVCVTHSKVDNLSFSIKYCHRKLQSKLKIILWCLLICQWFSFRILQSKGFDTDRDIISNVSPVIREAQARQIMKHHDTCRHTDIMRS